MVPEDRATTIEGAHGVQSVPWGGGGMGHLAGILWYCSGMQSPEVHPNIDPQTCVMPTNAEDGIQGVSWAWVRCGGTPAYAWNAKPRVPWS